mmetsp:Transcript_8346/g.29292  ORF Transcript_8346/g.29292 Transcript_8346/m.29292 type:complete len:204 (+) Transcript_8346:819-1430(+)
MECQPPALTTHTPLPCNELTSCGSPTCVVVPRPSWPKSALPHANTSPACVSARLWKAPALICATPCRPGTLLGLLWAPRWFTSGCPHPQTSPTSVHTRVCMPPAETCLTWSPALGPGTGEGRVVLPVSVPCLYSLPPHTLTWPSLSRATACHPPNAAPITLRPSSALTGDGALTTSTLCPRPRAHFWFQPHVYSDPLRVTTPL